MPPKKKQSQTSGKVRVEPIIAIVCDEIRREDNGKDILLGIYRGSITLNPPTAPGDKSEGTPPVLTALHLSLWVPFKASGLGEAVVEFEIIPPGGEKVKVRAGIRIEDPKTLTEQTAFELKSMPILFSKEGNLTILFRNEGEDEWETLRVVPVIFPS